MYAVIVAVTTVAALVVIAVAALVTVRALTRSPRPDFVTRFGIRVYAEIGVRVSPPGHAEPGIQAADIDAAVLACIDAFHAAGLWDAGRMLDCYKAMRLKLRNCSNYINNGRVVSGHTDGDWVVVSVDRMRLSESAIAHELAHYFGMRIDKHTDHTHASWSAKVYPAIDEAKRKMREVGV